MCGQVLLSRKTPQKTKHVLHMLCERTVINIRHVACRWRGTAFSRRRPAPARVSPRFVFSGVFGVPKHGTRMLSCILCCFLYCSSRFCICCCICICAFVFVFVFVFSCARFSVCVFVGAIVGESRVRGVNPGDATPTVQSGPAHKSNKQTQTDKRRTLWTYLFLRELARPNHAHKWATHNIFSLRCKTEYGTQPASSQQPEGSHHCRKASARAFLPWAQRVTLCPAVVKSSEPTKPPLQLGHRARRCQQLYL